MNCICDLPNDGLVRFQELSTYVLMVIKYRRRINYLAIHLILQEGQPPLVVGLQSQQLVVEFVARVFNFHF